MFFAALFKVYGDYKPQNRKSNSKQKTSPQSYKTQINILPFPGLAQTGTEQLCQEATLLGWPVNFKAQINILLFPGLVQMGTEQLGQGATLLGWPKSIYALVRKILFCHSKIKFISSPHRVISSMY